MSDKWRYGTILRRAVSLNPPVFQYVMFICPSDLTGNTFRGVRLNDVGTNVTDKLTRRGWLGTHLRYDLFEPAEEFDD